MSDGTLRANPGQVRATNRPAKERSSGGGSWLDLPLRLHLILLVLICVLPLLGFAVSAVLRLNHAVRDTAQQQVWAAARAISSAIDLRINGAAAALNVLARSPALIRGDLRSFYERCRDTATQHGGSIILAEPGGQEIFSTTLPFGAPLPRQPEASRAAALQAIATKEPQVSDLFFGRLSSKHLVSLTIAVTIDGNVFYTMDMALPAEAFTDILRQQNLPESWTVSVIDRKGIIVARNRGAETFVGSSWPGELHVSEKDGAGNFRSEIIGGGMPAYGAVARSPTTGWMIDIGIPKAELDDPAWQSLRGLVVIGILIALFGIGIAAWLGRRLARSMSALSAAALALGRDQRLPRIRSSIREVGEVAAALADADNLLQKSEARRRRTEHHLERAQHVAALGSWEHDRATGTLTWSDETYRLLGLSPAGHAGELLTAEVLLGIVHPEDRASVRAGMQKFYDGTPSPPLDFRILRPDGEVRLMRRVTEPILDDTGELVGLLGTIQDITETSMMEEQLRHAQKMEAIGALTGGMAHDFNNLLGIIIGNLDLLRPLLEKRPEKEELLQDALDASLRGADLTRRLLAFARRQPLLPELVRVNDLLSELAKLLGRTLGEHIAIALDLADDVWPVVIDPSQLAAAVTNLATNARDAMPQGGRLTIATSNCHLDESYATAYPEVASGDYVLIAVSDTGIGMSPEVAGRIFEPFFTTKSRDRGSGLGLSMVFGFIKQSNGHINVYSEPEHGTTFRLYLPRSLQSGLAQPPAIEIVPAGKGETVLVVDDNPQMRRIVVRQLGELGYRVTEADSAGAALAMLTGTEAFDLLLTDIVMPGGVDGFELARRALDGRPRLKILLTSGFPEGFGAGKPMAPGTRLLSKPYRKAELARVLREILEAGETGAAEIC